MPIWRTLMKNGIIKFFQRIEKLLEIKSIITLSLLYCFILLTMEGKIDVAYFNSLFQVVIGFYFGTQFEKNKS